MMGNVGFKAERSENARASAELCYAIIEQARRDAMEIYAKTRRHNTANRGSPTEAAKQSAIAYFRDRVSKNDARLEERWWLHVIDDLGGKWRAMPEGWDYRKAKAADVPF